MHCSTRIHVIKVPTYHTKLRQYFRAITMQRHPSGVHQLSKYSFTLKRIAHADTVMIRTSQVALHVTVLQHCDAFERLSIYRISAVLDRRCSVKFQNTQFTAAKVRKRLKGTRQSVFDVSIFVIDFVMRVTKCTKCHVNKCLTRVDNGAKLCGRLISSRAARPASGRPDTSL